MTTASEPVQPNKIGILLRVGLFALIGIIGMKLIFPWLIFSIVDSLFVVAAMSVFASAAVANAIVVRVYERGRLSDLGLAWNPTSAREFLLGAGLAAAAGTLIVVAPLVTRAAHFEPAPSVEHRWASIFFISIVLLFGATGEEMLFHGYGFQLLIRSLGAWATILPAAVLFGLAHIGNDHANTLGILNTMLWGVLLGYSYVRTRALWLPIGLHFGWNLALPLLGTDLSGLTISVTGYALHWSAGDLWSGGGYGPEGGLPATLVVIVLFAAVRRSFADPDEVLE
jgi:membrane protease YdiL (CAAX protease family)